MSLLVLLAQCVAMFIASFITGSLPFMFKSASSGKRLKAISVFGMGILVGAALTIIIPEGVSTLYESLPAEHPEGTVRAVGLSLLSGFALMLLIESLTPHPPHSPPVSPSNTPPTPTTPLNARGSVDSADGTIRPPLYNMDSSSPIIPKRLHVRESHEEFGIDGHHHKNNHTGIRGLNATLGLVIHGAADGIALGASSLSGSGSLGLIVFIAVLVHKGPTALGLTTTLLSLNLSHPMIRKRLIIFSFAAPLGAILTYLVVGGFGTRNVGTGHGHSDVDGLGWWTGIALLFSGGSFLYVATVIQPLSSTDPHDHSHASHSQIENPDDGGEPELGKYTRTILLVTGMILPVVLSSIVGDQH